MKTKTDAAKKFFSKHKKKGAIALLVLLSFGVGFLLIRAKLNKPKVIDKTGGATSSKKPISNNVNKPVNTNTGMTGSNNSSTSTTTNNNDSSSNTNTEVNSSEAPGPLPPTSSIMVSEVDTNINFLKYSMYYKDSLITGTFRLGDSSVVDVRDFGRFTVKHSKMKGDVVALRILAMDGLMIAGTDVDFHTGVVSNIEPLHERDDLLITVSDIDTHYKTLRYEFVDGSNSKTGIFRRSDNPMTFKYNGGKFTVLTNKMNVSEIVLSIFDAHGRIFKRTTVDIDSGNISVLKY